MARRGCFRITAIPLEVSGSAFASSGERFASYGKGFFVVLLPSPLTGKRFSVMPERVLVMFERSSFGYGGAFVVRELVVVVLIDVAVVANEIGVLPRTVRVMGTPVWVVVKGAAARAVGFAVAGRTVAVADGEGGVAPGEDVAVPPRIFLGSLRSDAGRPPFALEPPAMPFTLRPARPDEIPALNELIVRSARTLSAGFYTPEQTEGAIRYVFGVDSNLVHDQTYFVVEEAGAVVAYGGWSRRRILYGGDQRPVDAAEWLEPGAEPAKIRAFFGDPEHARRRIGRLLLEHCAAEARAAGFTRLELMATLPGVPLYAALGFEAVERLADDLPDGTPIEFVRMRRAAG